MLKKTIATSARVLKQLGHDPRTIALILIVPGVLLALLRYVFQAQQTAFNQIAPMMLAIFPLVMMFLITSIATLRERTNGTLERLMTMPTSKVSIIVGYALAFSLLAFVQAVLVSIVMLGILRVPVASGTVPVLITAVFCGFLGTSLGLFVSAFAHSEFQAIQFMPAFIMPQLLICGLFAPVASMSSALQWASKIMPLTYAVRAMQDITRYSGWHHDLTFCLCIVLACGIVALFLGATTLRRQQS